MAGWSGIGGEVSVSVACSGRFQKGGGKGRNFLELERGFWLFRGLLFTYENFAIPFPLFCSFLFFFFFFFFFQKVFLLFIFHVPDILVLGWCIACYWLGWCIACYWLGFFCFFFPFLFFFFSILFFSFGSGWTITRMSCFFFSQGLNKCRCDGPPMRNIE